MALEFDEQLSRLEKPNRNEMTNKEYAVFNENVETMEKNWGFINNLFKVLPLNASQYIGFLDFKGSLFNPDTCYLTNADKEMIGVVVSSINCCSYCLTTHGDALRVLFSSTMRVKSSEERLYFSRPAVVPIQTSPVVVLQMVKASLADIEF